MTRGTIVNCEVARKASAEGETTFAAYEVPYREGMTVLDLMRHIADELDGTFAFYDHSCKRGFCGSCLVKVNGKNSLSCRVLVPDGPLRLEPALKTAKDFWPADSQL
ncbi:MULTISPECIES: 2Fe-2S iron-sulfur cluster-binding protein [Cohnella]|uniref:2Fe-2S iron-sulfur cluster-binding protein n=1 Tax=Cohnella TaxID=329857 RepID=UPI0009BAC938|nr:MULTISPECIES: 2Fe-2S iron-sulfur cluster-binding protein [Cohnella]MBN2981629.1 2Fe-2S iron-sulfur cluster binding domain-containing protein [Cohnella algarum]